ncbi:MAG TPA: aspartate carbamoyltransferase catalytic subunit [Xanthomonadales bacterium]|nr:aspartate carbamoyltransferase catalytic subunit [Xanthomonadales bacterium]
MAEPLNHFTDVGDCSREQLEQLLDLALSISRDIRAFENTRTGRMLVNLFYEASTRTRVSFEAAAKRLGMHVINVSATGSSVEKGESLEDTFYTIQAMGPDCIVVRHPEEGNAARLASIAEPGVHVINAGDGTAAHPSQALLDALTLKQAFPDLGELRLLMAGDIRHSRVARSAIKMLRMLGIGEIRLAGPPDFIPGDGTTAGTRVFNDLDSAVRGANAIMMLRIQKERISGLHIPDGGEYHREWGLTRERLDSAEPGCVVLHPGPMNRGVEISSEVADSPQSLIRRQVRNGLHTRMALLLTLTRAQA